MKATQRMHEEVVHRVFGPLAQAAVESATPDKRAILIGQLIGTGKRVLDVGCSYGLVITYLKSRGHEVVGIEFAPSFVEICRKRGISAYEVDIENDSFPEGLGSFDVVLCMETLEHLFDPLLVLREKVKPLLKPGGKLIVTVPNGAYLKDRLALLFGKAPAFGSGVHLLPYRPYNLDHKTVFTLAGLLETLKMAGFEVERVFPTPGYEPGVVVRTGTKKLWNSLARLFPGLLARDFMCEGRNPG